MNTMAMNTYYEGQKIERFLKHTFDSLYAQTILETLYDVVKENCYGCEVDHPSQVQHTCIMMTRCEHFYMYFDLTFNKIIFKDMIIKFRHHVEIMDIPLDYKTSVLEQLEDWCYHHKPNAETVWPTTERMYSLENRFED